MPSGARRIPRTGRPAPIPPPVISSFANDPCGQRYAPLGATIPAAPVLEQPALPKHFPFPDTPIEDEFIFEVMMCLFTIMASGLQYLHLYRSVWWLPNSYTSTTLNFYLIDPYLVFFIDLILTRRLVYLAGCKVLENFVDDHMKAMGRYYLRSFLFGAISVLLAVCAYYVMQHHPMINILYLGYPVLVYLILFGFNICPFFEVVNWAPKSKPPVHACSMSARESRREVESLRRNFNNRMKQILFSSILMAYYAGFIPCCFTQPFLHYDTYLCTRHALFIFLSGFTSFSVHILSVRYCDILHRSALHLGAWEKIETGRTMLLVSNTWRDDTLWPHGALVRYGREIWRAMGDCNSSEPGNLGFNRFHNLFKNPASLIGSMLVVHLVLCLYQLILLCRTTIWYPIVSLAFILFFNYYILFKLCRDYLVSHKIYVEERNMHKKINMR